MTDKKAFDKYESMGAYHWNECDRSNKQFNPPLEARYKVACDNLLKGGKLLDVGCGDGYLMYLLKDYYNLICGIDFDKSGIKLANQKLLDFKNCQPLRSDCYILPFPDQTFDSVVIADVFEHLENPETCLKEISRVLKIGGNFVLTTPKKRDGKKWDERHVKEYSPDEVADQISKYFVEIDIFYFWPVLWSKAYSTRIGWRLIPKYVKAINNPFMNIGTDPTKYGQIIAVCKK